MLNKIYYQDNIKEITDKLKYRKEEINVDVTKAVEKILKDIKEKGDVALKEYVEKFDGYKIKNMNEIIVSKEEIEKSA